MQLVQPSELMCGVAGPWLLFYSSRLTVAYVAFWVPIPTKLLPSWTVWPQGCEEFHLDQTFWSKFVLWSLHTDVLSLYSPLGVSGFRVSHIFKAGFPDSSVAKESACNARDPSLIPGLGRSPREGIGYPLQYSWISLVAQLVKNLPAMWETWVYKHVCV